MLKKVIFVVIAIGCWHGNDMQAMNGRSGRPTVNMEAAAAALNQADFSTQNQFPDDQVMGGAYDACINYGLDLIRKKIYRTSCYNVSRMVSKTKDFSFVGTAAVALGAGVASLRHFRSVDNIHLQALACGVSVIGGTFGASLGQLFLAWNVFGLHYMSADKVKRRALLDGYTTIKALEPLNSQQIAQLELVFKNRFSANEYVENDPITPMIDDRVLELLACAKNRRGEVEMPADIEEQFRKEQALNTALIYEPRELYSSSGEPIEQEQVQKGDQADVFKALRSYGQAIVTARKNFRRPFIKYLVPTMSAVGYLGSTIASRSMPNGAVRTGLCLGGAVIGALVSSRIVNTFCARSKRFFTGTEKIKELQEEALQKVNRLNKQEHASLEQLCAFGHQYGYIPRCDGGWRGSVGERKEIYGYAHALLCGVLQH